MSGEAVERLWDVDELARFLGKHHNWIYRQVDAGGIPFMRVGRSVRFDPAEIREWLKASKGK